MAKANKQGHLTTEYIQRAFFRYFDGLTTAEKRGLILGLQTITDISAERDIEPAPGPTAEDAGFTFPEDMITAQAEHRELAAVGAGL